jgi:gluconokinase
MGPPPHHNQVVVVMGVSGAGKSTIGRRLADRLDATFLEGDEFHPPENVERMAAGLPLDEAARQPWLDALAIEITAAHGRSEPTVLACSALRRDHRDRLRSAGPVTFVFLLVDPDELERRVAERDHEFMPPDLLDDQLATLEPPAPDETDVVLVDATSGIDDTVDEALAALDAHQTGKDSGYGTEPGGETA